MMQNLHLYRYSKEELNLIHKIGQSNIFIFSKRALFYYNSCIDGKSQSEILELFQQDLSLYTWLYKPTNDLLNKLNDEKWVESVNKILNKLS